MPGERMEFSDMKYSSETNLTNGQKNKQGCYVSTPMGFLMLLLALAIAVGVGIIVHFAGNGRSVVCQCGSADVVPSDPQKLMAACKKQVMDGETGVCAVCKDVTTSPTAEPTTPPKVTDVRIPTDLEPILYTIELQPNMYEGDVKQFTFDGYVRIKMKCVRPTKQVTLQIKALNLTESTLKFEAISGQEPVISKTEYDHEREFVIFHLSEMLVKDRMYSIEMRYVARLKNQLQGLYLSEYKRNNQTVYLAATQLQPTDARAVFPCFDEPAIKAKFDVTLVRKPEKISLSNMPILRNETRSNGFVADIFETSPKMSTYLLAFIVCDFEYKEQVTKRGVMYKAWSTPAAVEQTSYALDVGVKILTYYEDYFNISFPLPKQDMIAIPDFSAGAMENWGLIIYRETAMLYSPRVSSEGNKQRVAVVVSHELAHQWFGDLVTPSWWDDLWLNEGFASFVEYMGVNHVHPEWKMFEQFVVEDLQSVFNFDALVTSHPVYVPVNHPDEINEIFDRISYAKGASIIRMMRFFLGEDTFRKGITKYLKRKEYDAAFHDDLWQALTEQATEDGKSINVKDVMDTWTLQMNYPTIRVTRANANTLKISQSRFLKDPTATDPGKFISTFGYKWDVPFTYTTSSIKNFNQTDADVTWLKKTQTNRMVQSANLPAMGDTNGWIIGNVMQYGFYRVNYDDQNWKALIRQLKTNHAVIHPINRAQIINDAFNLATSGDLSLEIALKTLEYTDKEKDYVPRVAFNREVDQLALMLRKTPMYGAFEAFIKDKIMGIFNEVTMNNTGATHLESYIRSIVASMACDYGVTQCIDESKRLFRQWMQNPNHNPINPGLKSTVYCAAIEHGGVAEWDFAFDQYNKAHVAAEKSRLLSSLSCSTETWIISRYLEWALTPSKIRKQDGLSVVGYISNKPIGQALAWDFFRNRWDDIRRDYGGSFFAFTSLVGRLTKTFNTDFQLSELQHFMDTHPNQGSGTRAFQQAVEKTRVNIKWMKQNSNVIKTWLSSLGL
ncbi:aminopeptidase N-like [Gigantopelta aegis]|uniref:aminopeptidase N-like n=1 Tax=Gigantopelta aegis TaxID=1735272 RepID=UPI001B88DE79|nr:aminopeptidase N-like [Gigantopelta aegis]